MYTRNALAAGLVAVLLAGCTASGPTESTGPTPAPTTTSTTTPTPTTGNPEPPTTTPTLQEPQAIDWSDPAVIAEFEGGWTIRACEGDGPFLCVERNGEPVGSVEAAAYPIDSIDVLDPEADPADNLARLADDFIQSFRADRAAGCGADYRFTPIDPEPFPIGGGGLVYGFEGVMPNGDPSELNLQYVTIVGDTVIGIVAAAYDEGGCPGRDDTSGFDSAGLAAFRDYLELVLEWSPLPDLTGS